MYVNPFWFGFGMGFLVETTLIVIASLIVGTGRRERKDGNDEESSN